MRTILLAFTALVVAVLMFVAVRMMSGADPGAGAPRAINQKPTTVALPETGMGLVGPGETAGWDKYDEKTGKLTSRIRVDRYEQQADKRMKVEGPRIDLAVSDEQYLRVIGGSGLITMLESEAKKGNAIGVDPGLGRPRGGTLKNVTLLILKEINDRDDQAMVNIAMDNLSFDCETWRIQTEAYTDAQNKAIAAEWAPVQVRGTDYEFDGYGLSLQYNEMDKRLDYLRIAHGKRLLVKNTDILKSMKKPEKEESAALWPVFRDDFSVQTALFGAVRTNRPATRSVPTRPATIKPVSSAPATVYQATFRDNIRVKQSDMEIAQAKVMEIAFLTEESSKKEEESTTRPADEAKTGEKAATTRKSGGKKTDEAGPTTKAAAEPVEVTWTGPLVVVPVLADPPKRIAPKESIVKLTGDEQEPVVVSMKEKNTTTRVQCATLTHWTVDKGTRIEEGKNLPVELTNDKGAKITTQALEYSDVDGTAVAYGASKAKLKLKDAKEGVAAEMADLSWKDQCTLYFTPGKGWDMEPNRALILGDVSVVHPRFSMSSARQDILMEMVNGEPAIKQVDADGNVKCLAMTQDDDQWKMNCDTMQMLTKTAEDGTLYPKSMTARGKVVAEDSKRKVESGYLSLTMKQPTTKPSGDKKEMGDLESLLASENVKVKTDNGAEALADQLNIDVKDGEQTLTLLGKPATVKNRTETLAGPMLTVKGKDLSSKEGPNEFSVAGAGKMTGIQKDKKSGKEKPFEVTWSRGLSGVGDDVTVDGDVKSTFIDTDGSVNEATGEKVVLKLTSTTRPTTRAANDEKKKTGELDMMSERELRAIQLMGRAKVLSTLTGADGNLQRRFQTASELIRYDRQRQGKGKLEIPGEGTLLFQDLRPASKKADSVERTNDPLAMRGNTAFKWDKSLVYDEETSRMTMTGNVLMARQEGAEAPLQVNGDQMIADIVKKEGEEGEAMDLAEMQTKMEFKMARVVGNVHVVSDKLDMYGHEIVFDPGSHLLTIRGQEGVQARQMDPDTGAEMITFDELVYNTLTNKQVTAKKVNATGRMRPRDEK